MFQAMLLIWSQILKTGIATEDYRGKFHADTAGNGDPTPLFPGKLLGYIKHILEISTFNIAPPTEVG